MMAVWLQTEHLPTKYFYYTNHTVYIDVDNVLILWKICKTIKKILKEKSFNTILKAIQVDIFGVLGGSFLKKKVC